MRTDLENGAQKVGLCARDAVFKTCGEQKGRFRAREWKAVRRKRGFAHGALFSRPAVSKKAGFAHRNGKWCAESGVLRMETVTNPKKSPTSVSKSADNVLNVTFDVPKYNESCKITF